LPRLQRFVETFDKYQTKVTSLSTGSLSIDLDCTTITNDLLRRIVPALPLSQLELGPSMGVFPFSLLIMMTLSTARSKGLRVCSISGNLSTSIFFWLGYFPSLRKVQLSDISTTLNTPTPGAPQVTQITYTSPRTQGRSAFTSPMSILPYVPSATIVSLDLVCFHASEYDSIPSLLDNLTPSLRILRLESAFKPRLSPTKPLDKLLPRFISLQELHLDGTFLPHDYVMDLLSLPLLDDLSLVLKDFDPDFLKLLEGPARLQHLRRLSIEFGPDQVGKAVDLDNATLEHGEEHWDEEGNGIQLLDQTESFTQMGDWGLSLGDEMMSGLELVEAVELAEKMERIARESDINVSTNLKAVRQAFYRQLVEYHNRGIGKLYLSWDRWVYDDALEMAKRLNVNLPVLEIDLKERVEGEKLEWFKVRMRNVEVDGKGKCYALNLRNKKK